MMLQEEILQTKPSLFFLWLFPAGIQVSLIMRINVKPLKRVGSVRRQQTSAAIPQLCTLTLFYSFLLWVHNKRSLTLAGYLGTKSPTLLVHVSLAAENTTLGQPSVPIRPCAAGTLPPTGSLGSTHRHTDTMRASNWKFKQKYGCLLQKANSFTKVISVEEE